MKILFLINGLTHYFNSILNRLDKSGKVSIAVIVPSSINDTIGKGVYQTKKGVEFRTYHKKEISRFYGKKFFEGFLEVINDERPDAIVFIWPYILELVFNPILLFKLKRKKIKIVFRDIPFQIQSFKDALKFKPFPYIDENLFNHGITFKERINNFFVALIRKYYYSFIDINLHYIEDGFKILKTYGVPQEKIAVTLNSPDTEKLIEAKQKSSKLDEILPYNPFRIIHVGRLVKWKRVDLIIKAVARLSVLFDKIELVVLGDGPELSNLQNITKELKIEHKINFIGAVYDPVLLGRYFNSSSIYVLGGMGGLSINEAMVFEKPVICSICNGTEKFLVRDGYNGYLFKNGDLDSLVEKTSLLLSDQNKIQELGKNSYSIINNFVNIDIVVNKYLNAFIKLNRNVISQ